MSRYSAKLLFQWRPVRNDGTVRKRRVCEERIILLDAVSAKEALRKAKAIGKAEEYDERTDNGKVSFEFVGVLALQDVSIGFTEGEVWSEIKEMVEPMERRNTLVPKVHELDALRKDVPARRGRLTYDWKRSR